MPINTVKCPHCGARVNHILTLSQDLNPVCADELTCPRCKQTFDLDPNDISDRTLADTKELADFARHMDETSEDFERFVANTEKEDNVEEALNKADRVFSAARGALDEISLEDTAQSIDADQLLKTYSVPDVKQIALGKAEQAARRVQERYNVPDQVVDAAMGMADEGFDRAAQRISNRFRQ